MQTKRITLWRLTLAAAAVLSVITFTPVIIPTGEIDPTLAGMPVTLWAGIVIALLFVVLTYVAGRIHPENRSPAQRRDRPAVGSNEGPVR